MEQFDQLTSKHIDFIKAQQMYFVASAGAEGRVNLSPKGLNSFSISDSNTVHWLNLTGSGNETAAHVLENQRMTIMFCSFTKQPLILRLFGEATMVYKDQPGWDDLVEKFPENIGSRQIFTLAIEMVQTSCGYGVPYYDFVSERDTLNKWAERKQSKLGLKKYIKDNNSLSIDGKDTGLSVLD